VGISEVRLYRKTALARAVKDQPKMRSEKVSDQGINGYNGSMFVTSLLPRGWHKGATARLFSEAGTLVIKNETPRYD
jgi:hypothetical protein